MVALAVWLKTNGFRPDAVQAFLPSPMASATAMYHSGMNPLVSLKAGERVTSAKHPRQRRLHKALLRYHDAENWPLLREELTRMGRADLIGNGKHHLVPRWQPQGTGQRPEGARGGPRRGGVRPTAAGPMAPRPGIALTQHTGLPPQPREGDRPRGAKPGPGPRRGRPGR
jgi:Domain of unknown function (DUF3362)